MPGPENQNPQSPTERPPRYRGPYVKGFEESFRHLSPDPRAVVTPNPSLVDAYSDAFSTADLQHRFLEAGGQAGRDIIHATLETRGTGDIPKGSPLDRLKAILASERGEIRPATVITITVGGVACLLLVGAIAGPLLAAQNLKHQAETIWKNNHKISSEIKDATTDYSSETVLGHFTIDQANPSVSQGTQNFLEQHPANIDPSNVNFSAYTELQSGVDLGGVQPGDKVQVVEKDINGDGKKEIVEQRYQPPLVDGQLPSPDTH